MKSVHFRPSEGPAIDKGKMNSKARRIKQPVEVITDLKVASSLIDS